MTRISCYQYFLRPLTLSYKEKNLSIKQKFISLLANIFLFGIGFYLVNRYYKAKPLTSIKKTDQKIHALKIKTIDAKKPTFQTNLVPEMARNGITKIENTFSETSQSLSKNLSDSTKTDSQENSPTLLRQEPFFLPPLSFQCDEEDPIEKNGDAEWDRLKKEFLYLYNHQISDLVNLKKQVTRDEFDVIEYHSKKHSIFIPERRRCTKDRFSDIRSLERSRVSLPDGGYINASWFGNHLVTQAPITEPNQELQLESTISDFFLMLIHYKLKHVVMLAPTEGDKNPADRYWPENINGAIFYPNYHVTLTGQSKDPDDPFVFHRTIDVGAATGSSVHTFKLHHMVDWKDSNVIEPTRLLRFIQAVNKQCSEDKEERLVVHCTAGVGRSGVFVILDSLLKKLAHENFENINMVEEVLALRRGRTNMVQNSQQYRILYDTLIEYLRPKEAEALREPSEQLG